MSGITGKCSFGWSWEEAGFVHINLAGPTVNNDDSIRILEAIGNTMLSCTFVSCDIASYQGFVSP